jgi:hypothetical protein
VHDEDHAHHGESSDRRNAQEAFLRTRAEAADRCRESGHQGRFIWPSSPGARQLTISSAQLDALVLGLPWQRIGAGGTITLV